MKHEKPFTLIHQLTVIDCGHPPPAGDNGVVTYLLTTLGARATYSCTSDCYELDTNEDTLICLYNQSWSGSPPQCHGEHVILSNGKLRK